VRGTVNDGEHVISLNIPDGRAIDDREHTD
jgi:hypothetical protein